MAASRPNLDGILLLEQPFARTPFDALRRQLRAQQRIVERDLAWCATALSGSAGAGSSSSSSAVAGGGNSAAASSSAPPEPRRSVDGMSIDEASDAAAPQPPPQRSESERTLDAVLARLQAMKRKLEPVGDATDRSLSAAAARTAHLHELHQIESTSSTAFDEWSRVRLDRMLCDYLLRSGFHDSAAVLARSRGIESLVDADLFSEIARIEKSLVPPRDSGLPRSCAMALAWCSENKAALRKIKSTLEFELRLQEFIELSRTRTRESITEAMGYASRHLLPLLTSGPPGSGKGAEKSGSAGDEAEDSEAHLHMCAKVRRAMGLLAMPPGKWAYADLYSDDRWLVLSRSFRECALQIHSLPPQPILHIALSAGLSSLKLPACYSHEAARGGASATQPPAHLGGRTWGDTTSMPLGAAPSVTAPAVSLPSAAPLTSGGLLASSPPSSSAPRSASALTSGELGDERNANCPVCDADGLGQLAKEVPWSHHTNSTLVCRISGRVMDENDPPLCLPNGRVYSRTALQEMATANAYGHVTCPRTGQTFPYTSARKVFIS